MGEPRCRHPGFGSRRRLDDRGGLQAVPGIARAAHPTRRISIWRRTTDVDHRAHAGGNPELLLLDEPSEGLAPLVIEALLDDICALKERGVTILLAEQGVDFSLALADRVYILEKGTIRHTGPAAELRDDQDLRNRLLSL